MKEELNGIVISHQPIKESTLKRLLLIFDHIFFIEPEENRFLIPDKVSKTKVKNAVFEHGKYAVLYNGKNYQEEENTLLDKFDYAINKGIIRILDLRVRKFYENNWLLLRQAHGYDTANAEFMNYFTPLLKKTTDISQEDGLIRGSGMTYRGVQVLPNIPAQVRFFSEEENKLYHLDHQLSSIVARFDKGLATSYQFDLIPIFINEYIAKAFSHKIEIVKNSNEKFITELFEKSNNFTIDKIQYFLHRISETILPDEIINEIPVKELIIARNNSYQECIKLRRKLIKSIHFLGNEKYDNQFINEVEKYIKSEIEPLVNNYQTKLRENLSKFLKASISFSLGYAGSSIMGINQSLTARDIAYIAGYSSVLSQFIPDLPTNIFNKSYKKFNNTFSYFVNLKE